jgi:hypothetical protein
VIVVAELDQVGADLAAGVLACPRCGGWLRPWAHAAVRRIRLLDGSTRAVRPRRARCAACRTTQVLLPGWLVPRRADAAEVIGAALVAKATGLGWRRIAAALGRAPGTVRRWLRAARGRQHLQWLRQQGVQITAQLDPDLLAALEPQPTELADALTALSAAVAAWRHRFARHARPWTLIGVFTAGRLLTQVDHFRGSKGRSLPTHGHTISTCITGSMRTTTAP